MKEQEIKSAIASIAEGLEQLARIVRNESEVPETDNGPYVGIEEACRIMHCSRPTARLRAKKGFITAIQLGRRYRYSVPSMEKYYRNTNN